MRTIKVELTQEDDHGARIVKTLTGADAEQWQQWVDGLCLFAWTHRQNPAWSSLHWETRQAEENQPRAN